MSKYRSYKQIEGKDREELTTTVTAMYTEQKLSVRAISRLIDRSYSFVYNMLKANGVERRKPYSGKEKT